MESFGRSSKSKECSRCKMLRKELRKSYERVKMLEARLQEIEFVCRLPVSDASSSSCHSENEESDHYNGVLFTSSRKSKSKRKTQRHERNVPSMSVEVDPLNGISQSIESTEIARRVERVDNGNLIVQDVCSESAAADSMNEWDYINARDQDQMSDSFANCGEGSIVKGDSLQYPTPLPTLSPRLQDAEQLGNLLKEVNPFVREAGKFLCELVEEPTPSDFHNFARTIVERYPVFADNSRRFPWDTIKDRLRRWYMNRKYYSQNREETRARRAVRAAMKRQKREIIANGESGSEAN